MSSSPLRGRSHVWHLSSFWGALGSIFISAISQSGVFCCQSCTGLICMWPECILWLQILSWCTNSVLHACESWEITLRLLLRFHNSIRWCSHVVVHSWYSPVDFMIWDQQQCIYHSMVPAVFVCKVTVFPNSALVHSEFGTCKLVCQKAHCSWAAVMYTCEVCMCPIRLRYQRLLLFSICQQYQMQARSPWVIPKW